MLALLLLFLPGQGASAENRLPVQDSTGSGVRLEALDLCIFQVHAGILTPVVIAGSELLLNPELDLPGHVAGLLVLGPDPLTVRLDGEPMRTVRPDKSGAFNLKHYGKLAPQDLEAAFRQSDRADFDPAELQAYNGCYAAFAPVPGNALCPQERFTIDLAGGGAHLSVQVRQLSPQLLSTAGSEGAAAQGLEFSYLGNDAERFQSEASGAGARLAAIEAGIRHIEQMIGETLVSGIHVIDFKGRNNALTRNGFNEIWIYSQTFWNESPAELRTMIEHETLHLLADRCRFAQNGALRELFADLRGLESLSKERFSLITMGILPATAARKPSRDNNLLAFVNEMNFFKGMKGGHSRDNLDEFLASFLHTLVFIQDLERAVHAPVLFPDRFTRHLSPVERKCLLDDYVRAIYALKAALEEHSNVDRFLKDCLEHAARLQERLPIDQS